MTKTTTITWTKLATTLPVTADYKVPVTPHNMSGEPSADIIAAFPPTHIRTDPLSLADPIILLSNLSVDGASTVRNVQEFTEAEFNALSQSQLDHLVDVLNAYWACLPVNELDGDVVNPPVEPDVTFNHDVNRFHIVETIDSVESVVANYDYPTAATAAGYISTFGGTRDLRVAYLAELTGATAGGLQTFAVLNNSVPASLVEVKLTLLAAQGYGGIFGYTDIRVLEETAEPVV